MATAKQFITVLASQIGYREGYDSKNGYWNNDNKFGIWYGMNKVAWCAQFISWGANEVGALGTVVPKFAAVSVALKWYRARNQTGVWPPQRGDIGMLRTYNPSAWWADPDGWATAHVFAVDYFVADPGNPDAGTVVTVEGNTNDSGSAQGNGVYRLRRRDTRQGKAIIYARPKWDPEPVVVTPPVPHQTGGQSAPIHVPPPAPKPKPIPGATYTGSKSIRTANIRPGRRNEDVRRFNGLLWAWLCKHDPNYARANAAKWMQESSNLYGPQAQRATQEAYRVIKKLGTVTLPTWPGPKLVSAIGGSNR